MFFVVLTFVKMIFVLLNLRGSFYHDLISHQTSRMARIPKAMVHTQVTRGLKRGDESWRVRWIPHISKSIVEAVNWENTIMAILESVI